MCDQLISTKDTQGKSVVVSKSGAVKDIHRTKE